LDGLSEGGIDLRPSVPPVKAIDLVWSMAETAGISGMWHSAEFKRNTQTSAMSGSISR
jgi:hypothetical protein